MTSSQRNGRSIASEVVEALPTAYFLAVAFIKMIEDIRTGSLSRAVLSTVIGTILLVFVQVHGGAVREIRARFSEYPQLRRPTLVALVVGVVATLVTLWIGKNVLAAWICVLPVIPIGCTILIYSYFRCKHPYLYQR